MSGTIYSGTYTSGITLSNPATQRSVTVTGTGLVSNYNADAIFGTNGFAWAVTNLGTVHNAGTSGVGIQLSNGGTVANQSAGSFIQGSADGVLIKGAPGLATNLGTIVATGSTSRGVLLTEGGRVINGSAAATGALIQGVRHGVQLNHAAGTVTNFGTILNTDTSFSTIKLNLGGAVTNGSAGPGSPGSTSPLIGGGANAIYIAGGPGKVTNFGGIVGRRGVLFNAGGTVANGLATSPNGAITGTASQGVLIHGGAGTVTNFGIIRSLGTTSAVNLRMGGRISNGSAGSTSALLTSQGTGIYIGHAPGTLTNFGTISASSVRGNPVTLDAGGTVANAGTIQSNNTNGTGVYIHGSGSVTNTKNGAVGGLITANGRGIDFRGGAGTVINSGSIQSLLATGIYLGSGGTVTNQVGGIINGRSNGVFSRSGVTTIGNAGTIQASAGTGVYLLGGSLTNQAGGLLAANGNVVFSRVGAPRVSNAGTIQSPVANGLYFTAGGTVTNAAGAVIAAAQNGIVNIIAPISVNNAGTIRSSGTLNGIDVRGGAGITNQGTIAGGGAGIRIGGPNDAIVANSGLISGNIGVYNDPFFGSNLTLTNSGTIASTGGAAGRAVVLGNSGVDNVLIVNPGASFIGSVNGGGNGEVDFVGGGGAPFANMFGFSKVVLGNGVSHALTVTDANFQSVNQIRITVVGGDSGNTVNAAAVTAGTVIFVGGAGADFFRGATTNDTFRFSVADLGATDKIQGNGGADDRLVITTPGTIAATQVTGVEVFELADDGSNTLALTDANFIGTTGGYIRIYGGNGGDTLDGSGVTGAARQLVLYGGSGIDTFTGGAGGDVFVFAAAALSGADNVAGGGGNDELLMTTSGIVRADGVSGVETFALADGAANTLVLAAANFTDVASGAITVSAGNNGNAINAGLLGSANRIIVHAGAGADTVTGGAGDDVFFAGGKTTMKGGAGANEFVFTAPGNNAIVGFAASGSNELVFSNAAFNLGFADVSPTPQPWSASAIADEFVANSSGSFTTADQRLAYATSTGDLFYSPSGSSGSPLLVAHFTGSPPPAIAGSQLFFIA